ncbi:hypothetical protein IPdc08_01454 [archaeon]|nr:hypothetical protein IPdc08_01454 [archaeon]
MAKDSHKKYVEFHCNCPACGKLPKQKKSALNLWVESPKGMLCEECWKKGMKVLNITEIPVERHYYEKEAFCCFCVLCGRTPPDPEIKIWAETEMGCLCEICLKRVVREGVEREIQNMMEE